MLLDAGASIDFASRSGVTPLHRAAAAGHVDVVRVLLARGAARDLADERGRDALAAARSNGHANVESVLLAAATASKKEGDGAEAAVPSLQPR